MKTTIFKIQCDICQSYKNAKTLDVMAIGMGSEYEYGTLSWEKKPVHERVKIVTLDLCEDCQNKLLNQPLFYIQGFYQPNRYYFQEVKNER